MWCLHVSSRCCFLAATAEARKRTKEAADQVHSYSAAAQWLLKMLPPGGRASKALRTLGRMAENLNYGSPAANYPGMGDRGRGGFSDLNAWFLNGLTLFGGAKAWKSGLSGGLPNQCFGVVHNLIFDEVCGG